MWSISDLAKVAALAGAMPGVSVTLTGAAGGELRIGPHPHGHLCAGGLRHLLARWALRGQPDILGIDFYGASERGGVLARPGERVFAVSLPVDDAIDCLRARLDWPEEALARLSGDELLGVTVVRVTSDTMDDARLDEAAVLAHATCLVRELELELRAA